MNKLRQFFSVFLRWMAPGLGVKRWLFVIFLATTLIAVGAAMFLLDFYRTVEEPWWLPILSTASLRFLARPFRVIIFGGLGFGMLGWGIWGFNRAMMAPFAPQGKPIVDQIADFRRRKRGANIVALGGGTGQATLLRGLKLHSNNISAVVSVADNGGSSGKLRRSLGIPPPGDIRNNLAALSNNEDLISQLFQYRFAERGEAGLAGHSFGNLYLSALTEITGSFENAISASGKVLAVHGRVLPATLQDVNLAADVVLPNMTGEVRVHGESQIPESAGQVRRVWLEPNAPPAFPKVLKAILAADLIVTGPGSLYTSILPNLLVPEILAAIKASRALRVYVCNVATQPGETHGYSAGDHIRALEDHIGDLPFDLILCNDQVDSELPEGIEWVQVDEELIGEYPIYQTNVVDASAPWRHDSGKLAQALIDLLAERTGPLVN